MPIRIAANPLSAVVQDRYATALGELAQWLEGHTAIRPARTEANPNPRAIEFDEAEIHDAPHTSISQWDMQAASHVTVRLTNPSLRARGEWYVLHWRRANDGASVLSPASENAAVHDKKRKRKKGGTNTEITRKKRDDDEDGGDSGPKENNSAQRRYERRKAEREAKEKQEQQSGTTQSGSQRDHRSSKHDSRRPVIESGSMHVSSGRKHGAEEEDFARRFARLSYEPSTEQSRRDRHSRR